MNNTDDTPIHILRLILHPTRDADGVRSYRRFSAVLEGGGHVVTSHQPLLDGARELVARGYDPRRLLTARHEGSGHDSFTPRPIGELVKWTCEEGPSGPKLRKYTSSADDLANVCSAPVQRDAAHPATLPPANEKSLRAGGDDRPGFAGKS